MRTTIETDNIKKAISAISETLNPVEGVIKAPFSGYIASFGAAIIQSGLIPAVIFFEDPSANSEENRTLLIDAIVNYLDLEIPTTLSSYLLTLNNDDLFEMEDAIIEASIAIKLALRTFKKP